MRTVYLLKRKRTILNWIVMMTLIYIYIYISPRMLMQMSFAIPGLSMFPVLMQKGGKKLMHSGLNMPLMGIIAGQENGVYM